MVRALRGKLTMEQLHRLTAVIEREHDGQVALCCEFDIAIRDSPIDEARAFGSLVRQVEVPVGCGLCPDWKFKS